MWIKYFIPEDGDDIQHPNVFKVSQNGDLTLSHIKQAFPIPGQYHFRFLKSIGSNTVWMDLTDPSSAIPTYQGSIVLKASRIAAANVPSSEPVASKPSVSVPTEKNSPPVPKPPRPQPQHQPSERLLTFHEEDGHVESTVKPAGSAASAPAASASNGGSVSTGSTSPAPFFDDGADLLGMTAPTTAASTAASAAGGGNDLFGLETLQPTASMGRSAMNGPMGTVRTASPMGGMPSQTYPAMRPTTMSGGSAMGGGPMGGGPMGGGSMGGGPMGSARPVQPSTSSKAGAYDPFNDIGMGMGNGAQRGYSAGQYGQNRR